MREIKFRYKIKDRSNLLYDQDEDFGYLDQTRKMIAGSNGELFIVEDEMQYIGLKDKNGKEIYEGDKVKVYWLAELGITELDCEAAGVVKFVDCRFIVEFETPYRRNIMEEGLYEAEYIELTNISYEEESSITFEIIGKTHD